MLHQIHPNKIRQFLFLIVIALLFVVIIKELYFLLGAFLGSITLYVLLRNTMIKWVTEYKLKKWLAAILLILISILILIVPLFFIGNILFHKIQPIINNPNVINQAFDKIHQYLISEYNLDLLNSSNISKINTELITIIQKVVGSTMATLGSIFILFFIGYFMLVQTFEIEIWLRKNVPFKNSNVNRIINESRNLVYSNAVGIPIVAIIQGIVGLVGYWIFGVEDFIFMGILTAICSVIPFVGTMVVWIPLMLYQLAIGHTWQGVAIGLWGLIVIGSVDNIARFILQKKMADVHPLITIFGVMIGISIFGMLGIIFGPILISLLILLIKIYIDEFGMYDAEEETVL